MDSTLVQRIQDYITFLNAGGSFRLAPPSIDATGTPPDLSKYVKPVDAHFSDLGGYGHVCMGRLEMGTEILTVAVKHLRSYSNSPANRRRLDRILRRELTVWKRLQHENIVPLLGTVHHNMSTGMVSPWMTSGNLNVFARGDLLLSQRLQIPCDIAAGLAYLHSQDIIHGDLNGGNVLINGNGNACLIDFGLSYIGAEFEGTSSITSTVGGAIRYQAPELYPPVSSGDFSNFTPTLTFACDIWSLGCVILQALSGHMPYHNVKPDTIVMITVMNGIRPRRPPADALTDEYWNYINILWGDTPDSRPRAHEAHTALLSLHDLGVLYAPPSPASPTEPLPDLSEYVKYPDAHISAFSGHVDVQIGRLEMNGNISTVATKFLRLHGKSPRDRIKMDRSLCREIPVWKGLRHENIVSVLGMVRNGMSIGIVSPWMTSGNLHEFVKRTNLSLYRRLQISCDVAAGLVYLHSKGIIHGNLSGVNVLIDDNDRACLIDFGLSLIVGLKGTSSLIPSQPGGALRYQAPELVRPNDFTPVLTLASDIWSLGCIILQALSGQMPYYNKSDGAQLTSAFILDERPERPPTDTLTDEYWCYINVLWGDTPESRSLAREALACLLSFLHLAALHVPCSSTSPTEPLPDLSEYVKLLDAHFSACGAYGNVCMGRLEMGTEISTVAVKYMRLLGNTPADHYRLDIRLRREISLWQKLQHENIVPLLGTTRNDKSIGMVSPWMTSGNLRSFVQRTDLALYRRLQISCDVAAGLAYLHSKDIIHGDLSGVNVLIDTNGKACLTDFGLSLIMELESTPNLIPSKLGGALRYQAPELVCPSDIAETEDFDDITPVLTFACDIWSLGCVVLEIISGHMPYYNMPENGYDQRVMLAFLRGERPGRPPADSLTDEYWNCIQTIWGDTPGSRPSAHEAHVFLSSLRDSADSASSPLSHRSVTSSTSLLPLPGLGPSAHQFSTPMGQLAF